MAMPTQYDPLRNSLPLLSAMDRLFQDSFVRPSGGAGNSVPVDVEETADAYVITASLPGWKPEDVNVTVQEGTVAISGEWKAQPEPGPGTVYLLRERPMASFRRTLTFATPVDSDKAEANYQSGELVLTLPKAASAKPKTIKIGQNGQKQITAKKA
jgi:HSP20 family protein